MEQVKALGIHVGISQACRCLGFARSSVYRWLKPTQPPVRDQRRPSPPRTLCAAERKQVLDTLNEPRFADLAPAEVYASLLDQGMFICSIRTMYRVLAENRQVRERRNQLRHPQYKKPELIATGPNQVWSWDITKLKGPAKWTYFYLYVIMDIFSRFVVGWMLAHRESASLAKRLISQSCSNQGIEPGQLTIHADRGSSMKSKAVALLLSDWE